MVLHTLVKYISTNKKERNKKKNTTLTFEVTLYKKLGP